MSLRIVPSLAVLAVMTVPSFTHASDFSFCWIGANGYSMTGRMAVATGAPVDRVITEADVKTFKIAGYHDGNLLGTWDIRDLTDGDTWHLRFDMATQTFLTGGSFPTQNSQGWNANGGAADCGNPGFGFNSGNNAQDVCVNGTWIQASSIPPTTPLTATPTTSPNQCRALPFLSKSAKADQTN